MPDISCATFDTKEDFAMAEEWDRTEAGNPWRPSPEVAAMIERSMPEVEEAKHNDAVRCLENHAEDVRENINQQLSQQPEIRDFDKLDQEVWPTHQQLDEMVEIGEELGVEETEIIRTPLICATSGVEGVRELIHDMMWALHTQEQIRPWYRDDAVFSKIMFVDRQEKGPTGVNKLADFNPETKVLHIFKTAEDKFPTRETIKWTILPHEVFHGNRDEFMARIAAYRDKWIVVNAAEAQIPSEYIGRLMDSWRRGEITTDLRDEELMAEWYKRYVSRECSKRTTEFFDEYFSE